MAHPQSIDTFQVDPATGAMTQVAANLQVVNSVSPGAAPLRLTPSPDGHFVFVNWADSQASHLAVLATDSAGAPQMPAVQTVDLPEFAQVSFDFAARSAYVLLPSFDESTQAGGATIQQWTVDGATGKLTNTGMQAADSPLPFTNFSTVSIVLKGSLLLSEGDYSEDGFSSTSFYGNSVDPATGGLGATIRNFTIGWQSGDLVRTAVGAQFAAALFNGLEESVPSMTYVDVVSWEDPGAPLVHCTSAMSDACLNAVALQFDGTGNFLLISDGVSHHLREFQVDAVNKQLREVGPLPSVVDEAQLFFSPDGSLLFAVSDADALVHVLNFNSSTGAMTPVGAPASLATPFTLAPATVN